MQISVFQSWRPECKSLRLTFSFRIRANRMRPVAIVKCSSAAPMKNFMLNAQVGESNSNLRV